MDPDISFWILICLICDSNIKKFRKFHKNFIISASFVVNIRDKYVISMYNFPNVRIFNPWMINIDFLISHRVYEYLSIGHEWPTKIL